METKHLTNLEDISRFVHGGNAVFTLVSKATGTRYTYKVRSAKDDKDLKFVSVMYGSDNTSHYAYFGMLRGKHFQHATKKTTIVKSDIRAHAFAWFNYWLVQERLMDTLEFWHEGKCACCGRRLTVPESIASGIGPECAKRYAV